MTATGWEDFDERTARYLAGELDDRGFALLQSALREGPVPRARFMAHCQLAQECSEVTDARGLTEAFATVSREAPSASVARAPTKSPTWWGRYGAGFAAAAAVLFLMAVAFFAKPKPYIETALSPQSEAIAAEFAPEEDPRPVMVWVRVSLIERQPPGFQLTTVARTAEAWWLNQNTDWAPPAEEGATAADWLDRIGLTVVEPPAELAAELQLEAPRHSFDSVP